MQVNEDGGCEIVITPEMFDIAAKQARERVAIIYNGLDWRKSSDLLQFRRMNWMAMQYVYDGEANKTIEICLN